MGWWIALGVLVLLAILPLGVRVKYDAGGPEAGLLLGPVQITLYPSKKKETPEKAPKKKPPKKKKDPPKASGGGEKAPEKASEKKPASGGSWQDFLPLVNLALDLLVDFRRKLRVDRLECHLTLAGEDPADLALLYGRIWAALGNLWPRLERYFCIKKRDVQVACDFTAGETRVYARMDLTITLGRLLALGGVHGFRFLRAYLKILNQRKGGATT